MISSFFKKSNKNKGEATAKSIQEAKDHISQITGGQDILEQQIIFDEASKQVIEMFYKDETIQAFKLVNQIQSAYIKGSLHFRSEELNDQSDPQDGEEKKQYQKQIYKKQRQAIEDFLKKPEVKRIEKDYKILIEFTKEMKDMSKWTKFLDKPEQKIYYKKEEGLAPITCFIEGIINAPMINVLAVVGEVEHFKEWMPITPVSDILIELTPMRKLLYIRNSLQWPCWDREIFVEGAAYVIKEEKAMGLSMESVKESSWFGQELVRHPEELVETHINKGFTYIKYLNESQCLVRFFINIDIHLDMAPTQLMNWGMKNISGVVFDYIKQNSEKLPDKYIQLMKDKPEFYEYLHRKIAEAISD